MKVFAGSASVECDGVTVQGTGHGPVRVYAEGATVEVRDTALSLPEIFSRQLSQSSYIVFDAYQYTVGSYTRDQKPAIRNHSKPLTIPFHTNGSSLLLRSDSYTLLCDGVPVATTERGAATQRLSFVGVDLSAQSTGWHLFDLECSNTFETVLPAWIYLSKTGKALEADQPFAPAITGTYNLVKSGHWMATWAKVPIRPTGKGHPLTPRAIEPFDAPIPASDLYRRDLVPLTRGDPAHVNTSPEGMCSCIQPQGYAWAYVIQKTPSHLLRDGPRGIGTLSGPTHVEVGRAAPPSIGLIGNVYFCDSWSFGKVRENGTIVRLAGFRHRDDGTLELLGDWSAIPVERRGFRELWGVAWDERTFLTNEDANPIPEERNLKPHITGVVAFLADSQNNRICKLEFSPTSHATPPKVTEHIVGLADPWDVVYNDGLLYISERFKHRIVVHDATTGAYVRTLVEQSGSYGSMWTNVRQLSRRAPLDVLRTEPCIGPEGLFYQDGFIYFGSNAQSQVRKVNLATGEVSVVCNVPSSNIGSGVTYVKIALSDGSFGPRGTVFCGLWDAEKMGAPHAYLPDGKPWEIVGLGEFAISQGRGPKFASSNYSSACGVGFGRLVFGSSSFGLTELTKARADEVAPDHARYAAGLSEYRRRGFHLVHGPDGYGQFDFPLPWGEHADIDYYLGCHHTRAGA